MINNYFHSDNVEKTVGFVLNGFYCNSFSPSIVEKNSNECFLFKYQKDKVIFYFDVSSLVIETKVIYQKDTIFHNFFYPFNKKTYIIFSDSRIFNTKNIGSFHHWIAHHKFI